VKQVEIIRQRILRGQAGELARLRIYISQTEGNQEAVDRLRDAAGDEVLAKVTDLILRELGHEVDVSAERAGSRIKRALGSQPRGVNTERYRPNEHGRKAADGE
jgi:hypothetical protein